MEAYITKSNKQYIFTICVAGSLSLQALYYKDKYELLLPTHGELNVSHDKR